MNYYSKNANNYILSTSNIDMSQQYKFVEKYLNSNSSILDVGFGSGRDMIYFKNKGYNVMGIDVVDEFVSYCSSLNLDVMKSDVLTFKTDKKFDLIWCCASLVHFDIEHINKALNNLKKYLTNDGVIYLSFKYGLFSGFINERYFTYINEESLKLLDINIFETKISESSIEENLKWINVIAK